MAEYRLSPAAERDLESIWKYTRAECGLEQAERYDLTLPKAAGHASDGAKNSDTE